MEARAHGAIFFGEVERGLMLEEKVLDEWVQGREVQEAFAAGGRAGAAPPSTAVQSGGEGIWARQAEEHVPEDVQGEIEFTGGVAYVERFQTRGQEEEEEGQFGVEVEQGEQR